jgi:hypothetical protein
MIKINILEPILVSIPRVKASDIKLREDSGVVFRCRDGRFIKLIDLNIKGEKFSLDNIVLAEMLFCDYINSISYGINPKSIEIEGESE